MNPVLRSWLLSFLPAPNSIGPVERLRASGGAALGILLTGVVSGFALDFSVGSAWLIAPMGASAVLLFCVPASPLAQPWSIVGGNLIAALIGVACAKAIGFTPLAAAVASGASIATMFALRCLHPPSGAVALTAVLGGAQVHAAGFGFALVPVALNSILLLVFALLYNNATGRRYPHAQTVKDFSPQGTQDIAPTFRLGFTMADLETVLKGYGQVRDISTDDLAMLFKQTEMQAYRRRFGETRCRDIMSRDVLAIEFATDLDDAWDLMQTHDIRALPVVDRGRYVKGIVTRTDFITHARVREGSSLRHRLRALLLRTTTSHSDKPEAVGQIMTTPVKTASEDTPIVELVPWMSDEGLRHIPIVNAERRLVGMLTQSDLVAALYQNALSHLVAPQPAAAA